MFRRKAGKENREHKEDDFNPFQLTVDANQLKFDEAALEKELISMLGSVEADEEHEVEVPSSSQSKVFSIISLFSNR